MTYTTISLSTGESFKAYVAKPASLPAPAIVVIQEIFGVNEGIRAKCDWLASEGFYAIAPDLFWRQEAGIELTDKTREGWDKALALMNGYDIDQGIEDLQAVVDQVRGGPETTGEVGCMGYCLGGKVAYLMACRTDVDASVGYYGVGLDALVNEAENIQGSLMLHIAGKDKFVPEAAQEKIIAALSNNSKVSLHTYEGMNHAFTRVGGDHYDANAAKIADKRTIDFFKKKLENNLIAKKAG